VRVRVANVLPYAVLKIFAFQDRHENKDSYDLVFCLLHFGDGPEVAGEAAARSPVARDARVTEALELLGERFADVDQDGPTAYGAFLAEPGDDEEAVRLRREAVATVRGFLEAFHAAVQ
jgi:predicted nucleotidyltransferase